MAESPENIRLERNRLIVENDKLRLRTTHMDIEMRQLRLALKGLGKLEKRIQVLDKAFSKVKDAMKELEG